MTYTLTKLQQQAVTFSKAKNRFVLAMGTRTGKTLTSLHITKKRGIDDILIITPTKVKPVWESELQKHFNEPATIINKIEEAKSHKKIKGATIISPKLLKELNREIKPKAVIVDEIHKMKGGMQFNALKYFCDSAMFVIALSATPADNRPADLYASFRIVQHPCAYLAGSEKYKSNETMMKSFLYRYAYSHKIPVKGKTKTGRSFVYYLPQFNGLTNVEELKENMSECFFIASNDFAIEKKYYKHDIHLTPDQRDEYASIFDNYIQMLKQEKRKVGTILSAREIVEAIKCRQYLATVKARHAATIAAAQSSSQTHQIIFTCFIPAKKHLLSALSPMATENIEQWRESGGVLVMSPAQGGAGLELVEASTMIFVDLDYRAKTNTQAAARILGPNQKEKIVIYHHLYAEDTIDRDIWRIVKSKSEQIGKIDL